jgi:chromosome segregation ATPase
MKKRYEFILEQKNDLVSAKESLLQTIQEVEATANQKFLETFHLVREHFLGYLNLYLQKMISAILYLRIRESC